MSDEPRYLDDTLPTDQRVDDLLSRMTLEEKIAQMLSLHQSKATFTTDNGEFDPENPNRWFEVGIGRIERPQENHSAREEAEYTNAIQRWVKENTRLGIPVLFHEEGLHGVMADQSTSFPIPLAMASSWNPRLVEDMYEVVAKDMRARGAHQALTPVVDVARDPRWGRTEETFGEDPYLTTRLSVASVKGLQGDATFDEKEHVIATLKHMTGHGQPQSGTNIAPATFSERNLREIFFPPFEAAIREAGALSVMASYNEIGGIPSHTNRWMLHDVLREEWGFDGVVVSDWTAISQLIGQHHVAGDTAEAARQALDATVDIDLPDGNSYPTLLEQVRNGQVAEAAIDRSVRRLLRAKFRLGLFEDPYVEPDRAASTAGAESQRDLALEAAQQGITLLKNEDGLLPLNGNEYQDVAVIGPHAAEVLLGGYASRPRHTVSIYEGVQQQLGSDVTVEYAEGVRITEDSVFTDDPQPHMSGERSRARNSAHKVVRTDSAANVKRIQEAVELARESDLAIVAVGGNEHTAREGYETYHLGDRTALDMVGQQEELVRAVQGTGTTTVTVLNHGRPAAIPELVEDVPALLETWYLGQETGRAVADAIFGEINPSGHLPVTIPRNVGQVPLFYNHKPSALRGYVFGSTDPLFPFGHGRSYTSFEYSNLELENDQIRPRGSTTATVEVMNTGDRAGTDVVQLYLRDEVSSVTRPVQELRGFERLTLDPGETTTVSFDIGPNDLSFYGVEMKEIVEPGRFTLMIGHSATDIAMTTTLDVVEK
jgi:beta-glucosidase